MSDEVNPICLRMSNTNDEPFIFNSWMKSFQSSPFANGLAPELYFKFQHKLIEEVFGCHMIKVAHHADDPNQIFGYIAYEYSEPQTVVIHYCFVKQAFRKMGIAKQLWTAVVGELTSIYHTHQNENTKPAALRKLRTTYNPYLRPGVTL